MGLTNFHHIQCVSFRVQLVPIEHFLGLLSLVDIENHYVPNSHLTFYQLNYTCTFSMCYFHEMPSMKCLDSLAIGAIQGLITLCTKRSLSKTKVLLIYLIMVSTLMLTQFFSMYIIAS
jgi:hypothetical protein